MSQVSQNYSGNFSGRAKAFQSGFVRVKSVYTGGDQVINGTKTFTDRIEGSVSGSAAKVEVTEATNQSSAHYPVFVGALSGFGDTAPLAKVDSEYSYNPNTGTLQVPNLMVNGTTTTINSTETTIQDPTLQMGKNTGGIMGSLFSSVGANTTLANVGATDGAQTDAVATTTNGSGSGLTVKLTFANNGTAITEIVPETEGSGYAAGNTVTIAASVIQTAVRVASSNSSITATGDITITLGAGDFDNWDRGLVFNYHDGTQARKAFFGLDLSDGKWMVLNNATESNNQWSGTVATLKANLEGSFTINADLNLGNNKIINLAAGVAIDDAIRYDQVLTNTTTLKGAIVSSSLTSVGNLTDLTVDTNTTIGGLLNLTKATGDNLGLNVAKNATIGGTLGVTGATTLGVLTVGGASTFNENVSVSGTKTLTVGGVSNLDGGIAVDGSNFTVDASTGATVIDSTLNVSGVTTLTNNLAVSGTSTLAILSVGGASTFNENVSVSGTKTLTVGGVSNLNGGIAVDGTNFTVNGTSGNTSTAGTLDVTGNFAVNTDKFVVTATNGNIAVGGTLGVTSGATIGGTLGVTSGATIGGTLGVTSGATIGGTLGVTSGATIAGTLDVTNTSTLGVLTVGGASTFNENVSVSGTKTLTVGGVSNLNGGIAVDGSNFTVNATSGATVIDSTLNVAGVTTLTNNLAVSGTSTLAILSVGGASTFNENVSVSGTKTLTVGGVSNLNGGIAVDGTNFTVNGTSGNTSTAGTLDVTGNFAVNTDKFVVTATNGNTDVAGTLGVTSNATIGGTLGVTSGATIGGTLGVTSGATIGGTLGVTSGATIGGTLGVTGVTTLGVLTVGGASTFNENVEITSNKTLTVGTGATSLGGALNVTGISTLTGLLNANGGIAVDSSNFTVNGTSGNTAIAGTLAVDTDTLFVDVSNDRVGINTATPSKALDVVGEFKVSGNSTMEGDVTMSANKHFVMPSGTGKTTFNGQEYSWPASYNTPLGSDGNFLKVDASGNLTWGKGNWLELDGTDTMGGNLQMGSHSIVFDGSTADTNKTTLSVEDPTGNQTVTIPYRGAQHTSQIFLISPSSYTFPSSTGSGVVKYLTTSTSNNTVLEWTNSPASGNLSLWTEPWKLGMMYSVDNTIPDVATGLGKTYYHGFLAETTGNYNNIRFKTAQLAAELSAHTFTVTVSVHTMDGTLYKPNPTPITNATGSVSINNSTSPAKYNTIFSVPLTTGPMLTRGTLYYIGITWTSSVGATFGLQGTTNVSSASSMYWKNDSGTLAKDTEAAYWFVLSGEQYLTGDQLWGRGITSLWEEPWSLSSQSMFDDSIAAVADSADIRFLHGVLIKSRGVYNKLKIRTGGASDITVGINLTLTVSVFGSANDDIPEPDSGNTEYTGSLAISSVVADKIYTVPLITNNSQIQRNKVYYVSVEWTQTGGSGGSFALAGTADVGDVTRNGMFWKDTAANNQTLTRTGAEKSAFWFALIGDQSADGSSWARTGGASIVGELDVSSRIGINKGSPAVSLDITATDAIRLPVGTTGERPGNVNGYIRYNTSLSTFEGYSGTWGSLGGVTNPVNQNTKIVANETTLDFFIHDGSNAAEQMELGMGYLSLPQGTTNTGTAGYIRYNNTDATFEGYTGSAWGSLGGIIDTDKDTFISAEASNDNDNLVFYTGGAAVSVTYVVTVASSKYLINGTQQPILELTPGSTYKFDLADGTNNTHPLKFSTTSDGTHNSGSEYTTNVTSNGTAGSAGAWVQIVISANSPTLYYYCGNHSGMGSQLNTPKGLERMRILNDGKVGIGKFNPSKTLDITGDFQTTGAATIGGTLDVSNNLTVTGTSTFNGNVTVGAGDTLTVTDSVSHLNGGIAVTTDKFTVAHTSGNTLVKGTFTAGSVASDGAVILGIETNNTPAVTIKGLDYPKKPTTSEVATGDQAQLTYTQGGNLSWTSVQNSINLWIEPWKLTSVGILGQTANVCKYQNNSIVEYWHGIVIETTGYYRYLKVRLGNSLATGSNYDVDFQIYDSANFSTSDGYKPNNSIQTKSVNITNAANGSHDLIYEVEFTGTLVKLLRGNVYFVSIKPKTGLNNEFSVVGAVLNSNVGRKPLLWKGANVGSATANVENAFWFALYGDQLSVSGSTTNTIQKGTISLWEEPWRLSTSNLGDPITSVADTTAIMYYHGIIPKATGVYDRLSIRTTNSLSSGKSWTITVKVFESTSQSLPQPSTTEVYSTTGSISPGVDDTIYTITWSSTQELTRGSVYFVGVQWAPADGGTAFGLQGNALGSGATITRNRFLWKKPSGGSLTQSADAAFWFALAGDQTTDGATFLNQTTANLSGTLTVAGATTLNGTTALNDNVTVAANKNLIIKDLDTFKVDGTNGNITVGGTASMRGNVTIASTKTLTVNGLLIANGGIAVDTDRFTVADATGNTTIKGSVNIENTLVVTGQSQFGNSYFNFNSTHTYIRPFSGSHNVYICDYNNADSTSSFGDKVGIGVGGGTGLPYDLTVNGTAGFTGGPAITSDDRIKYHEQNITDCLATIKKLVPQKYEKINKLRSGASWIPTDAQWDSVKSDFKWESEFGFVAQSVKAIPELSFLVTGTETDTEGNQTPLGLNYDGIFTVAVGAIKELSNELTGEKAKIVTLEQQETKLHTLESSLDAEKLKIAELEDKFTTASFAGQNGLIVSANKNQYDDGTNYSIAAIKAIRALPQVSLTTKENDKSWFGVICDGEVKNEGTCGVWVTNQKGNLESGDFIVTSSFLGYAQKQQDDILRNYTVARITRDVNFNPLVVAKKIYQNGVLIDTGGTQKEYEIRYLDTDGTVLSLLDYNNKKLNGYPVYIAAYIGCVF